MGKSFTTSAKIADTTMELRVCGDAIAERRSVPKRIEFRAQDGKAALDNADLAPRMIQDTK